MPAVTVKNGVVRFDIAGDFFVPIGGQSIHSVIVHDDGSAGSCALIRGTDGTGDDLFVYESGGVSGTHWFDLGGCVPTGGGVYFDVTPGDGITLDMTVS